MNNSDNYDEPALSNYLVLKNIFSNLDNTSLEACYDVNKFWRSVADPLLVRYYDIELKQRSDFTVDNAFILVYYTVITRRTHDTQPPLKDYVCSLEDASELLGKALKTERIAINLSIMSWFSEDDDVADFLCGFGKFVHKVYCDEVYWTTTTAFCELLTRYFPNLKHLDLSDTAFCRGTHYFHENFLARPMNNLLRIDFGKVVHEQVSLVNIFRMAPNLTEIYGFPALSVDALVETQKAACVKSLTFTEMSINDGSCSVLQKLAGLSLKLCSFSFKGRVDSFELFCHPETQPFVQRILESSSDSLESLTLYRTEAFDFKAIPPMRSLKEITFCLSDGNDEDVYRFFPPNIELLRRLFPRVSIVNIISATCPSPSDLDKCLSQSQFASWGTQIERLKLWGASQDALQHLSKIFPSVKNLEVHEGEFQISVPAVRQYWPGVEYVTDCRFNVCEKTLDSSVMIANDNRTVQISGESMSGKISCKFF